MQGYLNPEYAWSFSEFGKPRYLERSGGWILVRPIPGGGGQDAMGCYPLCCCSNWAGLQADLEELEGELVSLVLVTDPFGNWTRDVLERCFPDNLTPFKTHFVVDLSPAGAAAISKHHRDHVRRALRSVSVRVEEQPAATLADWLRLYAYLRERHQITGIRAFSETAFERQLNTPGAVMFLAASHDEIVGMQWGFLQGDIAYSHLTAYSPRGYRLGAGYALHDLEIEYFRGRARWFDLGAGAGAGAALDHSGVEKFSCAENGLAWFKQGWANATRSVYLCGRILDRTAYRELTERAGQNGVNYFPAYRAGEFS
jgi:hypothetical protein